MLADFSLQGNAVIGMISWITKNYGEEKWKSVVALLPPEDQNIYKRGLLPISRVPAPVYQRLFKTIIMHLGQGDPAIFIKMGRSVAHNDLNMALKVFLKIGSPGFIIKKIPIIYSRYVAGARLTMISEKDKAVIFLAEDARSLGWGMCEATMGWMEFALDYSGARQIVVEHTECVFKQGTKCVFKSQWQ
ncbi:hypothetical protein KAR34_10850 [bacterium]|nr:hypothetical protein [bacterium]